MFFESVRKRQRLFLAIILLLILPAFGLFGVSEYQSQMSGADDLAVVDGQKISRQEFENAQRRQLDNLREVFGSQFDPAMLDTPPARREVLEGLIAQRALLAEAQRGHMQVSDDALRSAILNIPGLRKPDGSFDRDQYRMLLAGQNLKEASFEAQMRRDIAIQTIPESIVSTAIVPRAVVDQVILAQGQSREVRELIVASSQFAASVKPTEAQMRKYYDENLKAFESPESLKIEYVTLDPLALAPQIVIDETKVKDYYEQNKARYSVPEQRQASHILLAVPRDADQATRDKIRAKAEALLTRLKGGADFAALAKSDSEDPGSAAKGGDLGLFTPEMMVKPVSDAVFALQPGQLSGVVSSEFGYHLIKLTRIEPGSVKPFAAVRPEIEAEFRRSQAAELFARDAEAFSNMVYEQSDSLKPVADRFKLKIETQDQVLRTGVEGALPNTPLANPKLLAALFSDDVLNKGRNTEAIEVAPQAIVSARVVTHHPVERKAFETVQDALRQRVIAQESQRLAQEAGARRLKELQSGPGLTKETTKDFSVARAVTRGQQSEVSLAAVEPIFRAPTDKLPTVVGVDLGNHGYGLYEIVKVTEPDEARVAAQRESYQQQLTQVDAQSDLASYLEALKARSKVERNLAALGGSRPAED